ncbi:hypothetical protein V6N12_000438 [Hibiscus sabdariffa]|uniref:Uncharacterized protein n=1 Tax=Hibiscus sabdariffa TaxID=183260 RepID=A0ABR2BIB0_9ROSI
MKHIFKATHRNPLPPAQLEDLTSLPSSSLSSSFGASSQPSSKSQLISYDDSINFKNGAIEKYFHKFQHHFLIWSKASTLLKSIKLSLMLVDDQKVYVGSSAVHFFVPAIISHFRMLPHETNTHASTITDKTYKQVLYDLCIEGTQWTKKTLGSRVVKWLQLKLGPKIWIYFMNTRLMPIL